MRRGLPASSTTGMTARLANDEEGGGMKGEIIAPGEPSPAEIEAHYALAFNAAYRRGLAAIVEAGLVLAEAKATLEHGRWLEWLEHRTPISTRTAQELMRIAGDPNIGRYVLPNASHDSHLPQDRRTLVEICGMAPERFDGLVSDGIINPEMKRGEVRIALARAGHAEPEPPVEALPAGKYRAILADPPWRFETWAGGNDRAPDRHYPTLSLTAIELMPVMNIAADDAALFLWVTSDNLRHAQRVMRHWDFELVSTAFVWVKEGPPGLGYWTRKGSEICLLGTRGRPKRLARDVPEVIRAPRGRHSEKPAEIHARIERLVPGPYIELFARARREGWDAWGNHPGLGGR